MWSRQQTNGFDVGKWKATMITEQGTIYTAFTPLGEVTGLTATK
jgi:hypothetical protein